MQEELVRVSKGNPRTVMFITHSVEEAQTARNAGASYINIGPLFATATKTLSTPPLGLDGLRRIAGAIDLPFTVMGGIKRRHVPDLVAAGARPPVPPPYADGDSSSS